MMAFEPWQSISVLIVLLSFSLSAVAIMLSRAFSNKGLEQWAKAEMVFAISTFLLVIFFFALFDLGQSIVLEGMKGIMIANYAQQGIAITPDQLAKMYPPETSGTLLNLSKLYMNNSYSCLRDISRKTYNYASPFFLAESFTKDAAMTDSGSGWGLKVFTQTAMNIINYTVFTAFLFTIFVQIINFVSAFGLPLFFPIGILLRAFPPTRGAGAYVLAFVLGFYFIFPLAYMLALNLSLNPTYCGVPTQLPPMPNMCNTANPGQAEKVLMWANSQQKQAQSFFDQMRDALAGALVNLLCMPFIAMVITMSFILASTNLFGANLPEVGRGFVKLI